MRVLVTGAEEHEGLAVIRGLGRAGADVIAAGSRRHSLGFASRYATACRRYRAPQADSPGFVADILQIVEETRPDVVIPAIESTMVALVQARSRIEDRTVLAAPPSPVLSFAIDKLKTLRLAARVGVPVPATVHADTAMDLLCQAARLRFPVAVKPRGPAGYRVIPHHLPFKVRYARDFRELRDIVTPFAREASAMLVQEYVPGTGPCVAAVCDYGEPIAMFAYDRRREWPHSGGVSVMRRSIALDHLLYTYTVTLLRAIGWRGVAMVEFKHDAATQSYTLMGINPQLQASTALSVDAGLNLPHLVASLFTGEYQGQPHIYALGVEARWLRGDLLALLEALANGNGGGSGWRALRDFAGDFRRGVKYDEFQLADWRPGVVEAVGMMGVVAAWATRYARGVVSAAASRLASWVQAASGAPAPGRPPPSRQRSSTSRTLAASRCGVKGFCR